MGEKTSKPVVGERKARIAKIVLVLGLLFVVLGAASIVLLSLPEDGTVVLTNQTYVRLEGRLLGHISGSYCKNDLLPAEVTFYIVDQDSWDVMQSHSGGYHNPPIVDSYGTCTYDSEIRFSADLPSSEAYYIFIGSVQPDFDSDAGYGPGEVLIRWQVWGPTVDYSLAYVAALLVGVALVIYGDYAGQNRIGGAIYSGWKKKGV